MAASLEIRYPDIEIPRISLTWIGYMGHHPPRRCRGWQLQIRVVFGHYQFVLPEWGYFRYSGRRKNYGLTNFTNSRARCASAVSDHAHT